MTPILELDTVSVKLPEGADRSHAMSDVTLSVAANEILCVVGESGSGKSMTANAIMRLLPGGVAIDAGRILFEGRDLAAVSEAEMRKVRGAGIAMIFQEPMTALNPLRTIGDQIAEMFEIHTDLSKREIATRVLAQLEEVRIPDPALAIKAYPHELSGGQRQRAMIAMALALDPKVRGDEPGSRRRAGRRQCRAGKSAACLYAAADRSRAAAEGAAATPARHRAYPDHRPCLQDLSHRRLSRARAARHPCGQGCVACPAQGRHARHRR
jgi:ABC-type dipeptide/oligopeptide/nickel transport system ATPase subunit